MTSSLTSDQFYAFQQIDRTVSGQDRVDPSVVDFIQHLQA